MHEASRPIKPTRPKKVKSGGERKGHGVALRQYRVRSSPIRFLNKSGVFKGCGVAPRPENTSAQDGTGAVLRG